MAKKKTDNSLKAREKALKMLGDGRKFVAVSMNDKGKLMHHQFDMTDEEVIFALESLKSVLLHKIYFK